MKADESVLRKCLFFTSNRLANVLWRIVNDVYAEIGLAAPYIYLLVVVNQYPGITISELSEKLGIAPSTCTRFVNKLMGQGILKKKQEWKTVHVILTDEGRKKTEGIDASLQRLHERCGAAISEEQYQKLSAAMWQAAYELRNA